MTTSLCTVQEPVGNTGTKKEPEQENFSNRCFFLSVFTLLDFVLPG